MPDWLFSLAAFAVALVLAWAAAMTFYGALAIGLTTGQIDWLAAWR